MILVHRLVLVLDADRVATHAYVHRDEVVLLHQRVDVMGCRRRHGPLGDGLGIDNERFAEDLSGELTALEERIVSGKMRRSCSERGTGRVASDNNPFARSMPTEAA